MKDEIFFTDEFRKSVWDKFENLEMKIQFLKGIVQNSMPIISENMDEFEDETDRIMQEIFSISEEIRKEYCKEVRKQ